MRGKFFSFRDGLQLPALWRWLLTLAGCLLTGLGLALACRLIDSQSLRQTLASLAQGSLWLTALFLALVCAVLTLLVNRWPLHLLRRVDWKTVLFFIGLFLAVSGLEQTGVLEAMADGIAHLTGGNHAMVIVIILWLSAVASAFVDNIPFAATMVPVILSLSSGMGVELNTLAWTLSMGTDIGGSATPIGASANVAGTSIAAREGHPISWGRYCKYSAPASVLVIAISMGMILLRY